MLWLRCRIVLIIFSLFSASVFAEKFNSQECLTSDFSTSVNQEGRFFGLLKESLTIQKEECIFRINYKKILETKWEIDICREPVHIKLTSKGSQSVYKRLTSCVENYKEDKYCVYWKELNDVILDHGLIFASGERESLNTSHGQTYCSYLLLKKYLEEGVVFSKYDKPESLFKKEQTTYKTESVQIPAATDDMAKTVDEDIEVDVDSEENESSGPF